LKLRAGVSSNHIAGMGTAAREITNKMAFQALQPTAPVPAMPGLKGPAKGLNGSSGHLLQPDFDHIAADFDQNSSSEAALLQPLQPMPPLPDMHTMEEDMVKLLNGSLTNSSSAMASMPTSEDLIEDVAELVNQSGLLDHAFANVTEVVNSTLEHVFANVSEVVDEAIDELGHPIGLSEELKDQLQNLTGVDKKKLRREMMKSLNITDVVNLRPNVDVHNGNRCSDDEEEHAGLCYKRCDRFAEGKYPFRVSAWQCCNHEPPCEKHDIMTSGQPCSGFGVSGDSMGNGCPHSPGGCFKDEELFGDVCYLRCSLLTYGVLPYRASPVACCNTSRPLILLKAGTCDTDLRYDAGGGLGGGEGIGSRSMPNAPHPPMPVLMERDGGW
jgi:hypothetical protein